MIFAKLDKISVREKLGFSIAGLFLFALLMDHLILQPVARKLGSMKTEIRNKNLEFRYNSDMIEIEADVTRQYQEIDKFITISHSDDETINEMKGEIDDLVKIAGMQYNSMNDREPHAPKERPDSNCKEFFVEIGGFEAKTEDLITFLYKIREQPMLLRVVNLKISQKEKGSVKGNMLIAKLMRSPDPELTTPRNEAAAP
ncbi:hypothetical protein ACFLS1_10940 [Verrucomicrobiota bacterium]